MIQSNPKNKYFQINSFFLKRKGKRKPSQGGWADQTSTTRKSVWINVKPCSSSKITSSNSDLWLLVDCKHLTESREITNVTKAAFAEDYGDYRGQGCSTCVCKLCLAQPQKGTVMSSCLSGKNPLCCDYTEKLLSVLGAIFKQMLTF